ncbi:unnamed protein product [Owenia fusiformis]|uniref:Uncharacterized protein n=1 Tax=Owenia fusiformis TaxID=6347 RepID=A0A8S4PM57_OWEFU|nr:unnamed protein product [Owenia fusiformis]
MRISYSLAIFCCALVTTDAAVPDSILRRAKARAEAQQDRYETQANAKIRQDEADKNKNEPKSDDSITIIERRPTSNSDLEDAKASMYRQMMNYRNRGHSRHRGGTKSTTDKSRPLDNTRKINRPTNRKSEPVKEKTIRLTSFRVPAKEDTDTKRRFKLRRFRPSKQKCCKIGERVGKKRLSCDVNLHESYHTKFDDPKYSSLLEITYSKVLANKIAMCSKDYAKNFNKCCRYRAHYVKEMDECKKLRGYKKKACRKTVRHRYP